MQREADSKKDLLHYMIRWLAFGAIAGLFTPVVSHNAMTEAYALGFKFQHLVWGLLFGAACGYAFTWFQNRFNANRSMKVSWSIAFTLWMGFNFAFAGMSML